MMTTPTNPAQCHPLIWASASISAHEKRLPAISQSSLRCGSGRPGRYDIVRRDNLAAPDVRPLALVPFEHQEARNVNARVGACDNTDEEGKGKVVDFATAEDIQRHRGEEHRAVSNDRAAQSLVQRLVHYFCE